jgi:hypothetical protein
MRSVPVAQETGVITASPPNARTTLAMRTSSVATRTASRDRAFFACSQTHWIMGLPARSTRGLPGKREEAKRAGMMPMTLMDAAC